MTEKLSSMNPVATLHYSTSDADLQQAAGLLKSGKLVAFPTETVYGLGTLGLEHACLKRLYEAKGRPSNNPVILHVHNVQAAQRIVNLDTPTRQRRFATLTRCFWPGPLTMVCPKADCVPLQATAGLFNVAVRIPSHAIAKRLLQLVQEPLAAPSANASTRISPTCAQHVLTSLAGRIDAVVDAGACQVGVESTVVDITTPAVTLLRPGAIGQQQLREVLHEPVMLHQPIQQAQAASAPGMLGQHYAPAIAHIALANIQQMRQAWHMPHTALLLRQSTAQMLQQQLGTAAGPLKTLDDQLSQCAQQLYTRLHELQQLAPDTLLIEKQLSQNDQQGLAAAIADRLQRACGKT